MKISMDVQESLGFHLLQVPFGLGSTYGSGIRMRVENHNQLLVKRGLFSKVEPQKAAQRHYPPPQD